MLLSAAANELTSIKVNISVCGLCASSKTPSLPSLLPQIRPPPQFGNHPLHQQLPIPLPFYPSCNNRARATCTTLGLNETFISAYICRKSPSFQFLDLSKLPTETPRLSPIVAMQINSTTWLCVELSPQWSTATNPISSVPERWDSQSRCCWAQSSASRANSRHEARKTELGMREGCNCN